MQIGSLVRDHTAEELRQYMRDIYGDIDRLKDDDFTARQREALRFRFLAERPGGTASDFISWLAVVRTNEKFISDLRLS